MGRNKELRRKIAGQKRTIETHTIWIEEEERKPHPDYALIHHWKGEIAAAEKRKQKLVRRLRRDWD